MTANPTHRRPYRPGCLLAALLAGAVWTPIALAQDGRPSPAAPQSRIIERDDQAAGRDESRDSNSGATWPSSRRAPKTGQVKLAFKDEPVDDKIFSFIAESTGKVVMPVNLIAIKNKKITLLNDEWIDRSAALDLLFQAFRLNQIGVIEKDDVIIVGNIEEIMLVRQFPILTAEDDVMGRQDKGSLVLKLFQLKEVRAEDVGEQIGENLPSYASLSVDPNSNQIVVMGDIALCQHLQPLIEELDHNYVQAKTQTFRLAYADATDVSENILDLFDTEGTGAQAAQPAQRVRRPVRGGNRNQPQAPGTPVVGPVIPLRVTVSTQQNSVTVTGLPTTIEEIAMLIAEQWDLPRSPGTSKIYTLEYTDPLKVAEKLNSLLGQGGGTSSSGGARRIAGRGGAAGGGSVDEILQGIYRIEPYPDTSQLLVFCKTEESLNFLDNVIAQLDQPTSIGLPFVAELKHANAIELAEELNALLSEAGAGATIERPGEGVSGRQDDTQGGTAPAADTGPAGTISFPWQRGGRQRDDQSPESALIGKVRIVPIVRQNALAVLCPVPQREAVHDLIEYFDRPGRQVMISAVIAAVQLQDDLSLGLRFSNSSDIIGGLPDYRIGGTASLTATRDNQFFSGFFDTSTLNLGIDLNIVLQALAQKTNVRILQEPLVFTADNQEALFFDGQEIPFISNTTVNTNGFPTDSFEYKEVGVTLNIRPRITVERDVDLEVLLELSNVVPGVTLFGGAVIDRRQTRTHVVVRNSQTIVISGIMTDTESKIKRKVPLLGDVPVLGALFTSIENQNVRSEIVAFITPKVVDHPTENDDNFNVQYRERLEDLTRPVQEQSRELEEKPDLWRRRALPEDIIQGNIDLAPEPPNDQKR